ncbi:MAG: hypothetical protein Q8P17_04250 [bacterium]|nr:hypothetical protein [bacterium]
MQLTPEEVYYEVPRKFYWTRIYAVKDDGSEATIVVGASRNFLNDYFRIPSGEGIREEHKNQWLERALADVDEKSESIEKGATHYKVYSMTEEGRANGLKFLREEVLP